MRLFQKLVEFEWDEGNRLKNWIKHRVSEQECEEIFFDESKKISKDTLHSGSEPRYLLIGRTKKGRLLFLVFTTRNKKIRVISCRDLNQREQKIYEE